jgi:acetyl-CoA acetyltransferase
MPVVCIGRDFAVSHRSTLSTSTTAACRCRYQSLTAGGLIYDHVSIKPETYMPMIDTAEVVAKRYNISREVQDEYATIVMQYGYSAREHR